MEMYRYPVELKRGSVVDTLCLNPGQPRHLGLWHGFGASPEVMGEGLGRYLAVTRGITVFASRMPCHGNSDDVDTFTDYVESLGQWCEAIGLSRDLVIGHSLGALVLPAVADLYPDQIGAGLCMSMPTEPLSGRLDLARRLLSVGTNATSTTAIALIEALRAGNGSKFGRAVRKTARDRMRVHNLIKVLWGTPDLDPVVGQAIIPMTYMWGEKDSATPPPTDLSRFPGKTIIVPGAKHCFPLERDYWEIVGEQVDILFDALAQDQSA